MDVRIAALLSCALVTAAGCDKLTGGGASDGSSSGGTATAATTTPPALGAAAFAVTRPPVSAANQLAVINDKPLSREDLELALEDLKASAAAVGQEWQPLSPENQEDQYDLQDLLNDLVVAELRAQDAAARGLDRSLEIQRRFFHRVRTFFAQEWIGWQVDHLTVAPEDVDKFYQENAWGFREPEQVRVRQLVLPSEDQAKAALVKLLEGLDAVTVAQQMSSRPDAAQGAMVDQWVMRSQEKAVFAPGDDTIRDLRDPVLEQAAFAIDKPNGFSSYVRGADNSYHIFQLVERKTGRQRPLVEVADNIKNFLQIQKLAQLTEELQTKARIQRFPERLRDVQQ